MDEIKEKECLPDETGMSDNDIYEAMRDVHGYLDITPADLKELYKFAYRHALDRLTQQRKVKSPPAVDISEIIWSWIGAFLGIATVSFISYKVLDATGLTMIIGSFGASAVLIYGAIKSPLAQPRNLLGGHIFSALIGVTSYQMFQSHIWLAAAIAVATALAVMHATRTLHPPGGATALIAVIGGGSVHKLGYLYALIPTAAGASIMLSVALLVNNIPRSRKYPEFWF